MQKLVILVLMLAATFFASAGYVDFIGHIDGGERVPGVGAVGVADNWAGGVVPYGSDTGRIPNAINAWTGGIMQNNAVRLEGGTLLTPNGLAMRGGTSGSGVTTLLEIDTSDWASVDNLDVPAGKKIVFWSQYGESMELNVLNGSVKAELFESPSAGKGTLNLGNGIVHIGTASGTANYNMLSGGSGDIVYDEISTTSFGAYLNFETGNTGTFTLGQKSDGTTTAGVWAWYRDRDMISIDGVVTTDPAAYNITQDGLSSTISLVPEPATMILMSLGSLLLRRKR